MKIKIRKPLGFSEIGRKDNQEDFLWPDINSANAACSVFLMCDGIGGQDSGEVASATVATKLGTYLVTHPAEDGIITKPMFEEALNHAYDELDKVDTGAFKKMGTTMTCVALHKNGALVAHIGDSRIYHVRPSLANADGRTGIIYQSEDHSLVNDLLRAGEITPEEAMNFPQKNVITRAMQPHLERRYKADIYNIDDVLAGDYFFLCCDGVLEQLTNEKLGAILADEALNDEGKLAAIKEICDGKTKDNYTCWLIPVDEVIGEKDITIDEEEEAVVVATVDTEDSEHVSIEEVENHRDAIVENLAIPVPPKSEKVTIQNSPEPLGKGNTKRFPKMWIAILALCLLALIGWGVKLFLSGSDEAKDDESLRSIPTVNSVMSAEVQKTTVGDNAEVPENAESAAVETTDSTKTE